MLYVWIGLGGAIGSALRYAVSLLGARLGETLFPWHTLACNAVGAFALGMLIAFADRKRMHVYWKEGLGTGLLGGFTTLSAFGGETVKLAQAGHGALAIAYVAVSIAAGIALAAAGIAVAGSVRGKERPADG